MHIIIAYDITDDPRRNKVANLLKDYGRRVQYSVFEFSLDDEAMQQVISGLEGTIDQTTDRIHIYHLCEACRAKKGSMGKVETFEEKDYLII